MSEKQTYPQIPTKIWWGFRDILITKPSTTFSSKMFAVQFDVQETAAKAYIKELQKVGLVNEDGKPTKLALEWRLDNSYEQATKGILQFAYPEDLLNDLNLDEVDREKAKSWFMLDGLGSGAAGNKAATLAMIAAPTPSVASQTTKSQSNPTSKLQETTEVKKTRPPKRKEKKTGEAHEKATISNAMPLNVNLQIHISADSSNEQIELIFKSMKKYLYQDDD